MNSHSLQGMTLKNLLENPNLLNPPKLQAIDRNPEKNGKSRTDEDGYSGFSSAFLGPNLWEKTMPFDCLADTKIEYMDLDEFLNENSLGLDTSPVTAPSSPNHSPLMTGAQTPVNNTPPIDLSMGMIQQQQQQQNPLLQVSGSPLDHNPVQSPVASPGSPKINGEVEVDFSISTADIALSTIPAKELSEGWPIDHAAQRTFDPRKRAFSDEELRPQPMIKKSKKIFVPEEHKDIKYWSRREKNNVAAKRSRDARRIKENQIALRAGYLEKENNQLKAELERVRLENKGLKNRLSNFEKE